MFNNNNNNINCIVFFISNLLMKTSGFSLSEDIWNIFGLNVNFVNPPIPSPVTVGLEGAYCTTDCYTDSLISMQWYLEMMYSDKIGL